MKCPKCKDSRIWIEDHDKESWLRCKCGTMKLVEKRENGYLIKMAADMEATKLPATGTRLYDVFISLASIGEGNTLSISELAGCNMDVTNNHLRMLEVTRLAEILEPGQGKPGGTLWGMSRRAKILLGE